MYYRTQGGRQKTLEVEVYVPEHKVAMHVFTLTNILHVLICSYMRNC